MNSKVIDSNRELFGHPIGLFVLFGTEMWERFSFYGMKALLVFYLLKYHLFSDSVGNLTVGSYAALVYALPVLGGYLADKYLGFRKAVIFGGILLVLGHIGMAYEGEKAVTLANGLIKRDENSLQIFYFALALIIMGVGFLKANISSIVGNLYEIGDTRRDSGFTIFYMGINLGSLLATIICVWLGETYGWSYGFGAAGVGMFFGLLTFISGKKLLNGKGESNNQVFLDKTSFGFKNEWLIYIGSALSSLLFWQMVQNHGAVSIALQVAGGISFLYIVYYAVTKLDGKAREQLIALTILIIFTIVFWALFEQAYTSMNLFADRILDRHIFGYEVSAGQFLSFNALFIILLAPVFAWLWVKLGKYNPNTAVKFAMALGLVGLGFGALVFGINISGAGKVAAVWLILAYLLHTCGELSLSPV